MKPSQKELNEFILDLVEFMGKHFSTRFDKTRVAGGNEGVSIRIRRAESGSELEITTDRLDPYIDFGTTHWHYHQYMGSKEDVFARIQSDLTEVFMDRLVVVSGSKGDEFMGALSYRNVPDEEAIADYRKRTPGCTGITLKKWSQPESVLPFSEP
jgi:hypothetical protein